MKHFHKSRLKRHGHNTERLITRKIRQEQNNGFKCSHCKHWVVINQFMGTANRNHCNICLWSKHVDNKKGDRRATCQAGMRPVGLTFRLEGGSAQGEIMLIHACAGCPKISINRIASDDPEATILHIYESSLPISDELYQQIGTSDIYLAVNSDRQEILKQLYGIRPQAD